MRETRCQLVGSLVIETSELDIDDGFCATHLKARPGRFVVISVSDTGHGISTDVRASIFEPFFTTKAVGQGTGLGLATVYGIVEQARGFIVVYSEVGLGTTFKIYLPTINEVCASSLCQVATTEPLREGHETVLLVEDEQAVRDVAVAFLKRLGYLVFAFSSGTDALRFTKEHCGAIDLLLTDVVMPGMNGRELSERMLAVKPTIKIVFVSGYAEALFTYQGVLEEGVSLLSKPYSMKSLSRKLREVLGASV